MLMLMHLTVAALAAALAGSPGSERCATPQSASMSLWQIYLETQKVDSMRVLVGHRTKHHKAHWVSTEEDFTWKDLAAAARDDRNVKEEVIDGIEPELRMAACRMFETMQREGLQPGITSGYRDEYRQHIATGNKAGDDDSYHGSRPELGWGRGEAIDTVPVDGDDTWYYAWLDRYGPSEFGIGRPYGNGDPPHIGLVDGKEYAAHHSEARVRVATVHHRRGHMHLAHHRTRHFASS